ncbi:magnesium transporter [soil metagenome]
MRNPLLVPDLRMMLRDGETEAVREFFGEKPAAELVEVVEDLENEEADMVLKLLDPKVRAEVVSYLDADRQIQIVETMPPENAAELLRDMPHDDRADLVNRLDEDVAEQILRRMAQAEREDIRRLASYEAGTAGAVMTTDYATLPPHISVREAYDRLRREAPERETILTSYVVDHRRHLLGSISLQTLVLARPTARIEDVMQTDPISSRVDEDQEEVARKIQQYDLLSLPIVDADDLLVGIVTHDDAMDILRQEQSEDLLRFGAVGYDAAEADETPGEEGIGSSVRRRIGWLLLLFGGGTLTGLVVRTFGGIESEYEGIKFDAFIPLLIGTGGNAGSQTVGTVIRGLALEEIVPRRDFFRVLGREALTGLCLGILLAPPGFLFTWLVMGSTIAFSLVIAMALMGICIWADGIGSMVPMIARMTRIDPAVVSAPMISTLVDATGLMIFYTIATMIHRFLLT